MSLNSNSSKWITCTLGDIVTFKRGYDLPKDKMNKGNYPVVGSNGIIGYHDEFTTESPGITIGRSGNVGKPFIVKEASWSHNTTLFVEKFKNVDPYFVYYYLKTIDLKQFAGGSAVPTLNRNHIHPIDIRIPEDIIEQKKISTVLLTIDEKISVLHKINKNLFNIASSLQIDWMVNFSPFKSKQFKSSSFGIIPEDWNVGKLGDVIEILDSKRIPLSGQERENMEKIYPYYGAASLMDYVEDYIFDGIYLLIGEDGTVIDDKGFPILQYVWGKFWVNNHAHIVKGKNGFNVDSLYLLLSKTNIQSIVTGAVQAKVNQNNLKSLEIIIPPVEVMEKFNELIEPFFDEIRLNHDEIKKLQNLRDTLLPKLMSGEIDVSEIDCYL